jgi:hypothetical protein
MPACGVICINGRLGALKHEFMPDYSVTVVEELERRTHHVRRWHAG